MSRPSGEDTFTTGWHIHQSIVSVDDGRNLFAPTISGETLSDMAMHYLGGLLAHAPESCLLTTPTVTGYKRYRPYSIAPDRIVWSRQHRGAMLRVIDEPPGPATRIENRAGDPAANPYLYLASQILSGLDGIESKLEAPPPSETPYEAEAGPSCPARSAMPSTRSTAAASTAARSATRSSTTSLPSSDPNGHDSGRQSPTGNNASTTTPSSRRNQQRGDGQSAAGFSDEA